MSNLIINNSAAQNTQSSQNKKQKLQLPQTAKTIKNIKKNNTSFKGQLNLLQDVFNKKKKKKPAFKQYSYYNSGSYNYGQDNNDNGSKALAITAVVASAASLAAAGVAIFKKPKGLKNLSDDIGKVVTEKLGAVTKELSDQAQEIKTNLTYLETSSSALKREVDTIKTAMTSVQMTADSAHSSVRGVSRQLENINDTYSPFKISTAQLGDREIRLLDTRLPIPDEVMKPLQKAAPDRIDGLVKLPELSQNSSIHLLTIESKYDLRTGGLGDVPPQILENFKTKGEMWKPLFIGTQSVDGSNSNTVYKLTKNTDPSLDCDYIYTGTSTTIKDGKEVKESVFQPKYLKKVYETNIETNNGKRILKDKVTVYSGIEKSEVDGEIVYVKVSYIDSGEGKFNISNRKDLKKLGENFPDKKHLIGATDTNMYVHLDDTTEVERCAYFSKYKNEIDTKLKEEEFVRAEARSEKAKALINKRRELRNIKIDLNDTNTEKNLDELTKQKGNLEREIAQIRQKPAPDKYVKTTEFIVKGDASKNEKDAIVKYALRSPDAVMLNDWHVGPYAALCRYLSPLKNHFNEVSDKTAKKMTNMPLFKLIHNAEYQGASYESTEPVLNILFGKFAYPIVKNGAKTVPGMPASLSNTLAVDNHVNLMHMGAALADVDIAVSKTYAKELGSSDYPGAGFGGPLKPLFAARQREALMNRTLIGIINGNDKESFMLKGKKLNDLKDNYKGHCDNMIDLTPENFFKAKPEVRKSLLSVLSEHLKQVNAGNKNGLFPGNNGSTTYGNPDISKVTPNTPILLSAGRLVGQKGIDIETGAMRNLMKDFDKTFPGKEKPLIIILGSGQREETKMCIDFANEFKDNTLFIEAYETHGLTLLKAGSDIFKMPSWHEPCGLMQVHANYYGTVPVANRIGGLDDTIKDGVTGFLTDKTYTKDVEGALPKNIDAFSETLKRALNVFYNDKDKFNEIALNGMKTDYSWKNGSIQEYERVMKIKPSGSASSQA